MELKEYVDLLRAHAWRILRTAILVTVAAVAVTALQTPSYGGTAKVLVTEQGQAASETSMEPLLPGIAEWPERGLATQARLMELDGPASAAIKQLGLKTTPQELLKHTAAMPEGDTNIIQLDVRDSDPVMAADMANALAQGYVTWTRDQKRSRAAQAARLVEQRLADASTRIDAAQAAIAAGDRTSAREDELTAARRSYADISVTLRVLRTEEKVAEGSGIVVASATVNREPVSPNWPKNLGLGMALGLALGLGSALVSVALDDTVKSTAEAGALYDTRVLGSVLAERSETGEPLLSVVRTTSGPAALSYAALRDQLDVLNHDHHIKTLLVVSALDQSGTGVAANLASVLARSGKRVVLLDCNFRQAGLDEFIEAPMDVVLAGVLQGHDRVTALPTQGAEGLWALHSGKMPPNPTELLGSQAMRDLVRDLGSWADLIIMTAPPLLDAADAAAIARWADGVLVVTREGVTTRQAVHAGREVLESVDARVIGVVDWGTERVVAPRRRFPTFLGRPAKRPRL